MGSGERTFNCMLFLPGDARGMATRASFHAAALVVEKEGRGIEVDHHKLHAGRGGYGGKMLVLSWRDAAGEAAIYLEDAAVLDGLSGVRLPPVLAAEIVSARRAGGKGKWAMGCLLLVALLAVSVYAIVTWGAAAAVDVAVEQIPREWEVELGRHAATEVLGSNRVCAAADAQAAVNAIGERLVAGLEEKPYEFRFRIVDSPELNAFALPGGYVFVNFGLIAAAGTPDEVAGVLAHEIQHALRRHGLRNVVGRAGIGLVVGLLFGDVQGLAGLLIGGASELAALSFSREQEEEADRLGLDLVYRAGFDPAGMPTLFEKLMQEEEKKGIKLPSFLSSHPETTARIEALRKQIAERGNKEVRPLGQDWTKAVAECRGEAISDPDRPTLP